MAEDVQRMFAAEKRQVQKKATTGRLRREGRIPAIIYGRRENHPISLNQHEFMHAFPKITESMILTLKIATRDHKVLLKDYQYDILSNTLVHIDFYEIEKGKLLRTHVPVHQVGSAIGLREGGILETPLHELEIECLPKDIPEDITIDISALGLNQSIHVRDIAVPAGVKVLNSVDQVVVLIAVARAAEVSEEEEAVEEMAEVEEPSGEE